MNQKEHKMYEKIKLNGGYLKDTKFNEAQSQIAQIMVSKGLLDWYIHDNGVIEYSLE